MKKTEPNDPIAPIVQDNEYYEQGKVLRECSDYGLTKREYFAAMAMQGYLAGDEDAANEKWSVSQTAKWAVMVADALILELNKPI